MVNSTIPGEHFWVGLVFALLPVGYYFTVIRHEPEGILHNPIESSERCRMIEFQLPLHWNSWRIAGMIDDGRSEDQVIYDILTKDLEAVPKVWFDAQCVLDVWGRPYRLAVNMAEENALFYSLGRNGNDENGGGDDISLKFHMNMRHYKAELE